MLAPMGALQDIVMQKIETHPRKAMLQDPSLLETGPARVEWRKSQGFVDYPEAVAAMEARVQGILDGVCSEQVWLLEHPPIYTAGTSASDSDVLEARFPVYKTGRGGQSAM